MNRQLVTGVVLVTTFFPHISGAVSAARMTHAVHADVYHHAKKGSKPKLNLDNQGLALESILAAVKESYPDDLVVKETDSIQRFSFFSKLSSQFGFDYAKRGLPATIYQTLSPYLADRLSEENFYKAWDGVIHLSSSADVERAFAKNLKNMKVPASLATASAKVVATVVSELVG